jgi:hypothetical protein
VSEIATTEEAAAAVAASLLGQPGQPPVAVAEPAAPVVEAAVAPVAVEQPAVEPEPQVAAVAEAAPVAPLNLNPELPEDIAAELAEAEIDEEVEREVAAYEPETDEWGNPLEVDEDAVREAVKLRKRNEYLERELVKSKSAGWRKEIEQHFPLAKHAVDDILKNATSRRSALRAAKKEHDRILPHVQAYLADAKEVVDAERSTATEQAREQVAEAWGQPLTGPDSALSVPAVEKTERLTRTREDVRQGKKTLKDLFAEMLR